MRTKSLIASCALSGWLALAASCSPPVPPPAVNIIPKPVSLEQQAGSYTLDDGTTVVVTDSSLGPSADFLNTYLSRYYGFTLPVRTGAAASEAGSRTIVLKVGGQDSSRHEAYEMTVTSGGVVIAGSDAAGVFYGIQTLIQLLPPVRTATPAIGCVHIVDYPRFGYRGMMLDCGRHFFDTAFVKQFIDFLALHKMNRFHWHLTEDQGWRIEIKKYPRLTEVGAWRDSTLIGHAGDVPERYDQRRSGGFYTQQEIKAIVAYARTRYITVIPEIEMPGHSMAAIASYPELTCQPGNYHVGNTWGVYDTILCPTPYTFDFYENVLKEVMELFPSHYIHIGGDEAPKVTWNNSAFCRALMKKLHLKDADALQSYFINHMEQFLNRNGRDIIGWDEILQGGLAPHATVMSWRGEAGGIAAAKLHHDVIMSPTTYCYLDYYQSRRRDSLYIGGYLPLDKVYSYNPVPAELDSTEASYIKGVQANLWTEYIGWPTKAEYQLFPRMEAISEIAWTPQQERDYTDFTRRLQEQFRRYDLWGVSYSRALYEVDITSAPSGGQAGVNLKLGTTSPGGTIRYTTDGKTPGAGSPAYDSPVPLSQAAHVKAALFIDGRQAGPVTEKKLAIGVATGTAVRLMTPPAKKYSTGGAFTLVDGFVPGESSPDAAWLGWDGGDMDARIDLGALRKLEELKLTFSSDVRRGIYPPKSVTVLASEDGTHYQSVKPSTPVTAAGGKSQTVSVTLGGLKTRYVEVRAENYGIIPEGQRFAGNSAWLFIGEIGLN